LKSKKYNKKGATRHPPPPTPSPTPPPGSPFG
jgi:hypothetical protein